MRIVGLCKTLSCGEFLPAILETIYPQLDYIVFVNSDTNWLEEKTGNECKPFINSFVDIDKKIVNLECSLNNQRDQYAYGYNFIREHLKPDWIFVFDTDEVWEDGQLEKLFNLAASNEEVNAIAANMFTYIKSPFYRIDPPEPLKPCVMVRPLFNRLQGIRGNNTLPKAVPNSIYFHHFSYDCFLTH